MLCPQVLLVESDPLIARRFREILLHLGYQADSVVTAGSLTQARASISNPPVKLALVELRLPDGSGVELVGELREGNPKLCIVVMSARANRDDILAALRAGAGGYLLKDRDDLEVALALRNVLAGGVPIDPFAVRLIVKELCSRPLSRLGDRALSVRESEVLQLLAEGLTNRDIAARLFLSRHTVECHIRHVYRKLAVTSRTQAANAARQQGLVV